MQTLALEIIIPFNECTGRLSKVSTRHKHNWRGMQKKVREKSRECHNHKPKPFPDTKRKRETIMRKRNTKGEFKVQTLALEIITPLNECTGRLSRVSTWHKHNRRGMQKR